MRDSTVTVLSSGDHFLYGCLGGLIAYLAVFALPELRAAAAAKDLQWPTLPKLVVILLIGLVLVALGGGAAILLGDATAAKQAIAYGVGAEGIIGGVVRTAKPPGT